MNALSEGVFALDLTLLGLWYFLWSRPSRAQSFASLTKAEKMRWQIDCIEMSKARSKRWQELFEEDGEHEQDREDG